jgi:hypothetical protein
MSHIIYLELSCYKEASIQLVWRDAMMEECQSIMKNDVWDIVPRPKGKSVVNSKCIYKIKHAVDGSIKKPKVRFVAIGLSQVKGIDYDETLLLFLDIPPFRHYFSYFRLGLEITLDRSEYNFPQMARLRKRCKSSNQMVS